MSHAREGRKKTKGRGSQDELRITEGGGPRTGTQGITQNLCSLRESPLPESRLPASPSRALSEICVYRP